MGLDWPHESVVHSDELSTIFPTKMIEYLAVGRPIVAHCPENYCLAKFINQYKCGLVLGDPTHEGIISDLRKLNDATFRETISQNALKTIDLFNKLDIQTTFRENLYKF